MDQRELRQLIGLHQREGRARHLDGGVAGEIVDERAGEGGLAGAEVARERDHVAGRQRVGDIDRKPAGGVLVGQHHREVRGDRCGRRGQGQSHR
jgi:hypothetical protein